MIYYLYISILAGFLLDLWIGDPYWLPHPIRAIGNLISFLEKKLRHPEETPEQKRKKGLVLVVLVIGSTIVVAQAILSAAYWIHPAFGLIVEIIMCYQILATKCLKKESMKVYQALQKKDLEQARKDLSMIVGRDTAALDEIGVTKAAVETVAENTSDGVIAPLIYLIIGGPVLGFAYKAMNTMDSMVGYKNEKYLDFGRTAAKLDDIVNYLPARLSAYLMIVAAFFCGLDYRNAFRIYRRDRGNHASPNSAHTESVCAGALRIQLAGSAWYFGILVEKLFIGDRIQEIESRDIVRANRLLYGTAIVSLCLLLGLRLVIETIFGTLSGSLV